MELYDSIFRRKSTRKFLPDPLPQEQLAGILAFVEAAKPLYPAIQTRIELAGTDDVKGMVSAKAPHYLFLFSERREGYLANAGFLLQQADLYLSSQGLGSCWLGMAKTTAPCKDGLSYVVMLAMGRAQGSPHRSTVSAFTRKPLPEISSGSDDRLEAVRLAPSATNSQPWYLVCENGAIHVYRKKLGVIKAAMYGAMNQIDMGIALCHLWLASEQENRGFSFTTQEDTVPNVDGYEWLGTVH